MTTNPWARMNSGKAVSAQQTALLEVETMATKRRQQATKRKSGPMEVERRTLRPKLLRVDLREELIARPAVSPGLYRRPGRLQSYPQIAPIAQIHQRAFSDI